MAIGRSTDQAQPGQSHLRFDCRPRHEPGIEVPDRACPAMPKSPSGGDARFRPSSNRNLVGPRHDRIRGADGRPDGSQCARDRCHAAGASGDRRDARRCRGQSAPTGDHQLSARVRRCPAGLRPAIGPVRPQASARRRPRALHAICRRRRPVRKLHLAACRACNAGSGCRRDPGIGRGDRTRSLSWLGNGTDHVADHDRVHDRAGAGTDLRPGRSCDRHLAAHLHRPCSLRPDPCPMERAEAAGDSAGRSAAPAVGCEYRRRGCSSWRSSATATTARQWRGSCR